MVAVFRILPIALPLAEILVMIAVADQIGIGWTLLALAASAVLGVIVIRVLGAASLAALRDALARREPPAGALFRGACVLIAGMLLIVPGFLSDILALLLLIPPVRMTLIGALWRQRSGSQHAGNGATVIEAEYHEVRPDHDDPRLAGRPGDPRDPRV
ncbi:MAG: FxsA family protein [Proteobacteria bacterium]|nr:FxsA family protein [Pseudomonadota bacterium]